MSENSSLEDFETISQDEECAIWKEPSTSEGCDSARMKKVCQDSSFSCVSRHADMPDASSGNVNDTALHQSALQSGNIPADTVEKQSAEGHGDANRNSHSNNHYGEWADTIFNVLKGKYDVQREAEQALESGNIEDYCEDLGKRISKSGQDECAKVIERAEHVASLAIKLAMEEKKREDSNEVEDLEDVFEANFAAFSEGKAEWSKDQVKEIVCKNRDYPEFCDSFVDELKRVTSVLSAETIEQANIITKQVLEAAKAEYCKRQEREVSAVAEVETNEQQVESNLSPTLPEEDKSPMENHEDADHAISSSSPPPPPPPPPPKKMNFQGQSEENGQTASTSENGVTLRHRRRKAGQIQRELNCAISSLASDVIRSYQHVSALRKQSSPVLSQSKLDFIERQEVKKTHHIKDIALRLGCVFSLLNRDQEAEQLESTKDTLELLNALQSKPPQPFDWGLNIDAVNIKVGKPFYVVLLAILTLIGLALSLNKEWFALIMLLLVVLFCAWKSWRSFGSNAQEQNRRIQVKPKEE